ncbi:MAG: transcription termination/antitermination NusG family protein [Nibricoccus sp.]
MSAQTTVPADAQWFAVHTLSGQENKVKLYIEKFKKQEELEDYIFEILLPTEVVSEVKGGKKTTKTRKLYPGYVFLQMKLYGEDKKVINKPWYFVKEVAGVIGFVGGDHPAALRQSEIDEIRSRIEAASGKEVPKVQYETGEEVKINDGAFANLTGPHRRNRSCARQTQNLRLHFRPFHPGRTRILASPAHHRLIFRLVIYDF